MGVCQISEFHSLLQPETLHYFEHLVKTVSNGRVMAVAMK